MGYYIPNNISIENRDSVEEVDIVTDLSTISEDKALIVSVHNGNFYAYVLAYDLQELHRFNRLDDNRAKKYYLMNKQLAYTLSNYKLFDY